jgi:ankyrin repeat protein
LKSQEKTNDIIEETLREFCELAAATGLMEPNKALIDAVKNGRPEIVQTLLDGGADVHASESHGVPRDAALCLAAVRRDPTIVKILLAASADVHATDRYMGSDYPLRQAAANGNAETVRVFLAAGADLHGLVHGLRDSWMPAPTNFRWQSARHSSIRSETGKPLIFLERKQ